MNQMFFNVYRLADRVLVMALVAIALLVASRAAISQERDNLTPADAEGRFIYIIQFEEPGVLQLDRVFQKPMGASRPSVASALKQQQLSRIQVIESTLGRPVQVTHRFLITHNGIAARLSAEDAQRIATLPGIVSVRREPYEEINTFRGPSFIGADTIWDGSSVPNSIGSRGGGIVIGMVDTGVDPAHPSFQNDTVCGHGDVLPEKVLSAVDCSSTDSNGICNGLDPIDREGHGSHTASTAGGNVVGPETDPAPQLPSGFSEISGVAPCASIRSYKVCPQTSCPLANIVAGINNAIADQVDVINFSISGGIQPWTVNDPDRLFLDAVDADIFVAASAGNISLANPDPTGQVNHKGPWVMTVAASTHDVFSNGLVSASGPGTPPADTRNLAASKGSDAPNADALIDFPIRHFPGQNPDQEGCTPGEDGVPGSAPSFPPGVFSGAAALIRRGTCSFATKITNAFNAGAELVIIRNNVSAALNMITTGQPDIPAYSLELEAGVALQNVVSANPETATIDFEPILGDVLGSFSLRGPTPEPLADLTKPSVTAPGVNIFAAELTDAEPAFYGNRSGTSMASPHVAGSAALLRSIHPDWSPMEVKSALQMTAQLAGRKATLIDFWDPDDVGSGRIDLSRAARAGLVMDEGFDNFMAADPSAGGDVKTLNIPSIRNMNCNIPGCSFTRTVWSTLNSSSTWQVSVDSPDGFDVEVVPEVFSLVSGESQELTITADPIDNELGDSIRFGTIKLKSISGDQSPELHLTVALRGLGPIPIINVTPGNISLTLETGEVSIQSISISNVGQASLEWELGFAEPTGAECTDMQPGWVQVSPTLGMITANGSENITLEVDTSGLPIGNRTGDICITSNAPGSPSMRVPILLTVTELIQQADLAVALVSTSDFIGPAQPAMYHIIITNDGPRDLTGARIVSAFGEEFNQIVWSCESGPGAACPAQGSGEINELIDLASDSSVDFEVQAVLNSGTVDKLIESSVIGIVSPDLSDPDLENNFDVVNVQSGLFKDGFE